MKTLVRKAIVLANLCLLSLINLNAQSPVVAVQSGYPIGRNAAGAAYGNSQYLVLSTGSLNLVYGSATGTAWSLLTTSGLSATQLNSIAFGAGLFVVVGNSGTIQTSPDGITWTTRSSGTANNLSKVYFVNSQFFAIGTGQTLLTSGDAITWTPVAFNVGSTSDFFVSLAYGNGWFVLAARRNGGSSAITYRSTTAANNSWSYATDAPAWNGTNSIRFLKDKFWAFMIGNRMFTSPDGGTWTEITNSIVLTQPDNTTTSWNTGHQAFNGVWDGTKFSLYGCSAYYGYGSTFTSTDGINFTLLTKTAYIVPQESVILNGKYFICGNEGIVTSADGLSYAFPGASIRQVVKTATKYVGVGMIGGNDGKMYNSTDFNTWSDHSIPGIRELYGLAYDGSTLVAGGYTGLYTSADEGNSWTTAVSDPNLTFTTLAYGNSRFVAGINDNNTGGSISYSTDAGATWTTASTANNWYNKIKYLNGRFFALGYNNIDGTGTIMYSTDGITWTDVTPDLGFTVYYYNDVAFDGTKYHFMAVKPDQNFFTVSTATPANASSYGNIATCSNTPAGVTLGGNWDEGLLDYAGGKFTGAVIDIATGQDYILTSTDGSSWTALPQNTYSTISGSYVNGQTVQLVGRANAYFTVSYSGTLPLTLLKLEATPAASSVLLSWITAAEKNTKGFIIEHSTDGRTWNAIGTVNAAVNASVNTVYSFTHPAPARGANFYRLLMQDKDGSATYSRVVTAFLGEASKTALYPNPVTSQLMIRTGDAQPAIITIFNAAGQPVKRQHTSAYETSINLAALPSGTYIAQIRTGSTIQQLSFIKN